MACLSDASVIRISSPFSIRPITEPPKDFPNGFWKDSQWTVAPPKRDQGMTDDEGLVGDCVESSAKSLSLCYCNQFLSSLQTQR